MLITTFFTAFPVAEQATAETQSPDAADRSAQAPAKRSNGRMTATRLIAIVDRFALGLVYTIVGGGLPLVAISLMAQSA
jgi:hypothetical protein